VVEKCVSLSFLFVGLCFVLLIVSVFKNIETRVFINQKDMNFVGTKKKVIQSTSATERIFSSEPEQERVLNHCL